MRGRLVTGRLDRTQHVHLGVRVEAVAGLDLDRGRPVLEHARQVLPRARDEIVVERRRVSRTVDRMPPPLAWISS